MDTGKNNMIKFSKEFIGAFIFGLVFWVTILYCITG